MYKTARIFLLSILSLISLCSSVFPIDVEDVSYDLLVNSPHSDHVQHFQKLFQHISVHSFLEFGVGYATKYFLDNCQSVTSCEIVLPDQTTQCFDQARAMFQKYLNWTPILKRGSPFLQYANELCYRDLRDPALYDATYLLELKEICDELFKDKQFEVALVNPRFHMRGDLINELFDRVPIIVAHDTNIAPKVYGWGKIYTPSNYEKIVFTQGQGVIFWIRKDKMDLILALKNEPHCLAQNTKKMRIFFPQMHPILVQSMALTLNYLGHTLVLPGESFDPHSPIKGCKIAYGTFFKKNPIDSASYTDFFSKDSTPMACSFLSDNVEVIENYEMSSNPPDVLVVNCLEVEESIYSICWDLKRKDLSPKLVHYSGNNGSQFSSRWVKNLIAVDAYTASYYDSSKVNIIFWIPWIDFKTLQFEGVNDDFVINSYIAHYYSNSSLKQSLLCFNDTINSGKQDFPGIVFNSFPNSAPNQYPYIRHEEVLSEMNKSCATIHIKETEGFGYTIIESLAKGRPVFLKRSFSLGSRLMNWCIEGKTAFFFDDYDEFHHKLQKYLSDQGYRHQIQRDCAATIRKLIVNEKQARILDQFLRDLK